MTVGDFTDASVSSRGAEPGQLDSTAQFLDIYAGLTQERSVDKFVRTG